MAPLNVTPMSLSEVVKVLMDEPAQKERITTLQQGYAQGKVSKDEFTILLGQICGQETMTKALRIMVPGYDEMCEAGGVKHPPPKQVAPPTASTSAAAPNLKKGFLSGGSIAPKGGDAPGVKKLPTPKEPRAKLDGVDVLAAREHYYQHMQEAVPRMDKQHRDHLLHNNFVMHDAKSADNGGNVVLDPRGFAQVLSDESMGGQARRYTWGQNESEVTLKVNGLPKGSKSKDVQLVMTSTSIRLLVRDEEVCTGALYKPILADESTFVIEDDKAAADGSRLLTVTLTKREKTGGKSHWPCVVEGDDGKIDTSKFGPQCITADPNRPHELAEAFKMLDPGGAGGSGVGSGGGGTPGTITHMRRPHELAPREKPPPPRTTGEEGTVYELTPREKQLRELYDQYLS